MKGIRQANNVSNKTLIELDEPIDEIEEDRVYKIPLDNIVPSPFEPQARRRAKFKQSKLESLGKSIKRRLLTPIAVRPRYDIVHHDRTRMQMYEIVFGERRWLASKLMNLGEIKCFVKKLSDAEVVELQYEENHRRQDNDPLDDAYYFNFLQTRENYTISELADKFGTTEQNVVNKLKLNDLVPEAIEELEAGLLPLRHAYYLAKFPPAVQQEICDEGYAYRYYNREYRATSYKSFVEEIDDKILLRLSDAPFNTADPQLHARKLICADCTERTGYTPMLFPDLASDDSCLNRMCFEVKTKTHLTLQRYAIAARMPNPENKPIEEIAKEVPLVTEKKYTDEKTFDGIKPHVNQKLQEIPECQFSNISLSIAGEKQGQVVYACRNDDCSIHHPKRSADDARRLPVEKLEQLENDFNARVARAVRIKVLSESLNWFDDYKAFWTFDDLIKKLIVESLFNFATHHAHILLPVLRQNFKDAPKNLLDKEQIQFFAAGLSKRQESQILFLLSVASAADELEVLKIATDYTKADYLLLDAEARFELAPEEFKPIAEFYLHRVKSGDSVDVPHFWLNFDDVNVVSDEEN